MEWIINWWPVTILGPIVLAAAIGYDLLAGRRLAPGEEAAQDRAIEQSYKQLNDA